MARLVRFILPDVPWSRLAIDTAIVIYIRS